MELAELSRARSPENAGFDRVNAVITTSAASSPLTYWFDIPEGHYTTNWESGDPWAVLMLPIAVSLGEPIRLQIPVDSLLVENLLGVQRVWRSWYPHLREVDIEAPPAAGEADPGGAPKKSAAFLSGGVDSFFTLLRHWNAPKGQGRRTISDVICIAGFNTLPETVGVMQQHLGPVADRFGKRLVPVVTNLRYSAQPIATPYGNARDMIYMAHGAALGALAHLLGTPYDEVLVPASDDYTNLEPYGSHPLTDLLFSSRRLKLVTDGASLTRVERTAAIVGSGEKLDFLHVCWQDWRQGNCGKCLKCLCTMATLDIMNAADRAPTFDWSSYGREALSTMWIPEESERFEFLRIVAEARRRNRRDVADAILRSIRRSRRRDQMLRLVNSNWMTRRSWKLFRSMKPKTSGLSMLPSGTAGRPVLDA